MKSGESWLLPPQIYELSRLKKESDIDKLLPFARERGIYSSTTLMFPILYQMSDGLVICYPGDELYPNKPNYTITEHNVNQFEDKTCDECRKKVSNLHRTELKSLSNVLIWQNVELPDNHLNAQTQESYKAKL